MDTTPSGAAHLRRAGRAGGAVRKEAGVSGVGDSVAVCRRIRSSRYVSMTATVQLDEFSPRHSITSSARASSVAGMSMLSVLAVLRKRCKKTFITMSF